MATASTRYCHECRSPSLFWPASDQESTDDTEGVERAFLRSELIDVTVPTNTVQTTAEYIVVKKASPIGDLIPSTNPIVSDLAEILHRSQQPNVSENPQPPMLPEVTNSHRHSND